jgi:hypothetical protein
VPDRSRRKGFGNICVVTSAAINGVPMLLSFLFARWSRPKTYIWSPALDLTDPAIYSTLLPHTHA